MSRKGGMNVITMQIHWSSMLVVSYTVTCTSGSGCVPLVCSCLLSLQCSISFCYWKSLFVKTYSGNERIEWIICHLAFCMITLISREALCDCQHINKWRVELNVWVIHYSVCLCNTYWISFGHFRYVLRILLSSPVLICSFGRQDAD